MKISELLKKIKIMSKNNIQYAVESVRKGSILRVFCEFENHINPLAQTKKIFKQYACPMGHYYNDGKAFGKSLTSVVYYLKISKKAIVEFINNIEIEPIEQLPQPAVEQPKSDKTKNTTSAFKQVLDLIANTSISPEVLCSETFRQNAGLTYCLIIPTSNDRYINGKARYGKKAINICGNSYYVTNHIFAKNVDRLKELLK